MANLFFRTLSQALQALMPVAAASMWCARAGAPQRTAAIRRGILLSIPATVPAAWWFHHSAARAFDEAVLAVLAFAIGLLWTRAGTLALVAATIVIVVRQTMEIGSVLAAAALELRSFDATSAIVGAS